VFAFGEKPPPSQKSSASTADPLLNVTKPTFNNLMCQRTLMLKTGPYTFASTGLGPNFIPNNPVQAKKSIRRKDFGLYLDNFNSKHDSDLTDYLESKRQRVSEHFKHSYTNEKILSQLRKS
jgi:hypothetical protein